MTMEFWGRGYGYIGQVLEGVLWESVFIMVVLIMSLRIPSQKDKGYKHKLTLSVFFGKENCQSST